MKEYDKASAAVSLATHILERLDEHKCEASVTHTALGLAWAQAILKEEFSPSYFHLMAKDLARYYDDCYKILHQSGEEE